MTSVEKEFFFIRARYNNMTKYIYFADLNVESFLDQGEYNYFHVVSSLRSVLRLKFCSSRQFARSSNCLEASNSCSRIM